MFSFDAPELTIVGGLEFLEQNQTMICRNALIDVSLGLYNCSQHRTELWWLPGKSPHPFDDLLEPEVGSDPGSGGRNTREKSGAGEGGGREGRGVTSSLLTHSHWNALFSVRTGQVYQAAGQSCWWMMVRRNEKLLLKIEILTRSQSRSVFHSSFSLAVWAPWWQPDCGSDLLSSDCPDSWPDISPHMSVCVSTVSPWLTVLPATSSHLQPPVPVLVWAGPAHWSGGTDTAHYTWLHLHLNIRVRS